MTRTTTSTIALTPLLAALVGCSTAESPPEPGVSPGGAPATTVTGSLAASVSTDPVGPEQPAPSPLASLQAPVPIAATPDRTGPSEPAPPGQGAELENQEPPPQVPPKPEQGAGGAGGEPLGLAGEQGAGAPQAPDPTQGGAPPSMGGAGPDVVVQGGAGGASDVPEPGLVEDRGAECDVPDLSGADVGNDKLPDLFMKLDGSRMTKKSEWPCRRREIRRTMERYVYGEKPPRPDSVKGSVSENEISVNVSMGGKSTSFSVSVDLPSSGAAPYPAIIGYESFGTISLDERLVKEEGVAVIKYVPYSVGAEGTGRGNKRGAFYDIHGDTHGSTGLLAAWAWGVSRIVDVIADDPGGLFKADALAVTGCSRFGKGSFVAGAFDERIALGIPFESGTAGVPMLRGIGKLENAQSLSSGYGEQPWFGDAFGPFVGDISKLPLDTHATVAMYAPRGLLILDNPAIANLGPKSAHVAAQAGAEVFKALGVEDHISYLSDTSNGSHCLFRSEYAEPLRQSLRKHLFKAPDAEGGAILPRAGATGNLAEWRDWDTPTLQ